MVEITLFELNLDDASFSAKAPFSGSSGFDADADGKDVDIETEDDGGSSVLPFVVGLVFLAGLAFAIRKLRSGGSESVEIESEPDATAPSP